MSKTIGNIYPVYIYIQKTLGKILWSYYGDNTGKRWKYLIILVLQKIYHNVKNYGEHISHISEWKISQKYLDYIQKLWEIRFKISDLELDVGAKDLIQWGTQARSTPWRPMVFVTKNAGVRWSGKSWNNRFFNPLFTGKLGIIRHFLVKAKALNMKKFGGGWSWSKQQSSTMLFKQYRNQKCLKMQSAIHINKMWAYGK